MRKDKPSVLVAMLPKVKDWHIVEQQHWYRIPVDSAPPIIKNRDAKYIAFYHTAQFKDNLKWKVVFYAEIKRVVIKKREELFPNDPIHSNSEKEYYAIEFDKLEILPKPIVSRRGHRGVFVPTTKEKFFSGTTDFNRLFRSSYLEEKLEKIIDDMDIEYEREVCVQVGDNQLYFLDFAIHCSKGKIDIECDGDEYHMGNENVNYDKKRNNELTSHDWRVLRYTTEHFEKNPYHIEKTIKKTIKELGGATKAEESNGIYVPKDANKPTLF